MPSASWSLHPQLDADTVAVGDLRLSRLLLSKDGNFPWLILVPRRPGAAELIDLAAPDRSRLTSEIDTVGRALKAITSCDKLNIAALGNMVPQLHVHIIARRTTDAAWPRPVWGAVPPRPYADSDLAHLIAALRGSLGNDLSP